jgi:hypothetical protein
MSERIDLGHGHTLRYFEWSPDRVLNPQFDGIPDAPKAGAIIDHPHAKTGEPCSGAITFDVPSMRATRPDSALWQVESWDPLTISPSVLCSCGDHGFIRNGRWEPA